MADFGYARSMNPVNPKKLLLSKWTALTPLNKEKHFVVTCVVEPDTPGAPPDEIDLEAVHSGAVRRITWRTLRDSAQWRQGWI